MKATPLLRRDALRRGGFTLIEVAIALIIFVFGALAIIRIFPPGLGVIQNSGDQLTAVNMNRTILARNSKSAAPPDAIYDPLALESTHTFSGSIAGSARRNLSIPVATVTNPDLDIIPTALSRFKNVVAERHAMPSGGAIFTQFRYETTPLAFLEDSLSGVVLNPAGTLNLSGATQDSNNAPYTAIGANDKLYVSYRFLANNRLWGSNEELVPTNGTGTAFARTGFVPGPVSVRLRKAVTGSNTADEQQVGIIRIATTEVQIGQSVSLDYTVSDWRWLVSDSIPAGNPESQTLSPAEHKIVKLPVKSLDNGVSPFLSSYFPSSATGEIVNNTNISGSSAMREVNEKIGQVIFDTSRYPTARTSSNVRIVYRTLDNWANQLSVAARDYNLATASSTEKWRDYALNGTLTATTITNDGFLYFKPSEAGKAVRVTYIYLNGSVNTQVENRILTIDDSIIDAPSALSSFGVGGKVSRAQLTTLTGDPLTAVQAIQKVEGISVQSRTAWIDGNRFTQIVTTNFRGASN
jgi:Tfp pilus assembly protein PilV